MEDCGWPDFKGDSGCGGRALSLTLEPYPEYKESGAFWLGGVPADWKIVPAFAAFRERQEKNIEMRERQVLSLSYGRIVKKHDDALHGLVPASFETYQIVEPGNLILRLTDLQNDQRSLRVGLSRDRGIITSAYSCLAVQKSLLPEYAYFLLHAADVQKTFYSMGSGLRQSMGFQELRRMPIAVPSIGEQHKIVRFLQMIVGNSEKLIRAKRRVIERLNEQKQAIIHRAVTHGLDPNVRLKRSGIEWLNQIPEHWKSMRLARLIKHGPQNGISPAIDENGSLESFSISAVRDGKVEIRESDLKYVSGGQRLLDGTYSLLKGDILIVRGNGNIRLVGRAGLVADDMENRVYPDLLMRMRLKNDVAPEFAVLLLNDQITRAQVETSARTAVGTFKVNNQQVRSLWIALPGINEQRRGSNRGRDKID